MLVPSGKQALHNLLQFNMKGWTPGHRLVRHWKKRAKSYGIKNLAENKIDKATVGREFYKAPTASDNGLVIVALTNRSTTHGLERPTAREAVAAYDVEFG